MSTPPTRADDALLLLAYVVVYGALEAAYLTAASGVYARAFRAVQRGAPMRVRKQYAALAYAVLLPAVGWFLLRPVLAARSPAQLPSAWALSRDATVLALAVYGVYNLTNLATLSEYSPAVAAQDTAWGVACMNAVALAGRAVRARQLG